MKSVSARKRLLEEFKKMPVIQVACAKTGIARSSYYRWLENKKFKAQVEAARNEGDLYLLDMAESQLISLIGEKHYPAVAFYLKSKHPQYGNRLELTGKVGLDLPPLTPAQQTLVERALKLIHGTQEENHE